MPQGLFPRPPGAHVKPPAARTPLIPLLLACLLLLPVAAVSAVPPLYEAEVEVADSGAETRAPGIVAALGGVVTKVTGRADPTLLPAWPRLAAAADGLLLEYRYRTVAPADVNDPLQLPRTLLSVRFDRAGVERMLRQEGLPVWGETRPVTLLLIAVERGNERFVYTPDQLPAAAAALAEAAARRGIPLIEPLMDLEDRGVLRFSELWAGFPEVIDAAAGRYRPDGVLLARLLAEGSGWRAQWTLHAGIDRDTWETRGALAPTLAGGIDALADKLAARFVPDPVAVGTRVPLAVSGIASPADYGRVMAFLGGLTEVQAVRPVLASREVLELELVTDVDPAGLLRTIALGGVLVQDQGAGAGTAGTPLFRLRP